MIFDNSKVQNEIESYLLGFIYADGCVVKNGNKNKTYKTMNIKLSIKDKDFIFEINKYLNGKIKFYDCLLNNKKYSQIRLSVYDIEFCKKIIELGVIPNKTYSNSSFVFDNIPDDLKNHFIRGYFDGNGYIGKTKNEKYLNFELCSRNISFLESMLLYIKNFVSTNSKITKGDHVHRIRMGGSNQIFEIYNMMYKNYPKLFMSRKKEEFLCFINNMNLKEKMNYE